MKKTKIIKTTSTEKNKISFRFLLKYLPIIPLLAALCIGSAYSRYVTQTNISGNAGISPFNCYYSIDGTSSNTFSNVNYWIDDGKTVAANTVHYINFTIQNYDADGNGTEVDAMATFRFSAPKIFVQNLAVQLADSNGTPIMPQYSLTEILTDGTASVTPCDYGTLDKTADTQLTVTSTTEKTVATGDNGNITISVTTGSQNINYTYAFSRGTETVYDNNGSTTTINSLEAPIYYLECTSGSAEDYCTVDITVKDSMALEGGTEDEESLRFYFTTIAKDSTLSYDEDGVTYTLNETTYVLADNFSSTVNAEYYNVTNVVLYSDDTCATASNNTATVKVKTEGAVTTYYYVDGAGGETELTAVGGGIYSVVTSSGTYYINTERNYNIPDVQVYSDNGCTTEANLSTTTTAKTYLDDITVTLDTDGTYSYSGYTVNGETYSGSLTQYSGSVYSLTINGVNYYLDIAGIYCGSTSSSGNYTVENSSYTYSGGGYRLYSNTNCTQTTNYRQGSTTYYAIYINIDGDCNYTYSFTENGNYTTNNNFQQYSGSKYYFYTGGGGNTKSYYINMAGNYTYSLYMDKDCTEEAYITTTSTNTTNFTASIKKVVDNGETTYWYVNGSDEKDDIQLTYDNANNCYYFTLNTVTYYVKNEITSMTTYNCFTSYKTDYAGRAVYEITEAKGITYSTKAVVLFVQTSETPGSHKSDG